MKRADLGLCLVAYTGMSGAAAQQVGVLHAQLQAGLATVAETRAQEIVWGPVSYRPWWQPSAPALVAFVTRARDCEDGERCVVLRASAPVSVWDHNLAQLGWLEQEPWGWTRSTDSLAPAVCSGLHRMLEILGEVTAEESVPGAGRTLGEVLAAAIEGVAPQRKAPIRVVGHGLGGALAILVALWLRDTQGSHSGRDLAWDPEARARLYCRAFASPAVGNADFASYVSERLGPQLELVHNSLDPTPTLWEPDAGPDLEALYRPHVEAPPITAAVVRALRDALERHGVEYEQPPAQTLTGTVNVSLPPSFVAQVEYQHLHAYAELLGLDIDLAAVLGRPVGADGGPMAQ